MARLYRDDSVLSLVPDEFSSHQGNMSRVQPIRPAELNAYFADIQSLNGVGEKTADSLTRVMGPRIKDLVLTPPTQLIDRSYRPTIAGAISGDIATFEVCLLYTSPSPRD